MSEENVDIVDEKDKVIDTVSRSVMRKKNLKHRSTFILVFNSNRELLITKRTTRKDVFPGLLEMFHGGTVKHGESYEENAYREIEEELGIKNIILKSLFKFNYKDNNQNCIGTVYKCFYDRKIKIQKKEIESYFFVSLKKIKEMSNNKPEEFTPDGLYAFQKYLEEFHEP